MGSTGHHTFKDHNPSLVKLNLLKNTSLKISSQTWTASGQTGRMHCLTFLHLLLSGQMSQFYHLTIALQDLQIQKLNEQLGRWNRAFPVKYLEPCPAGGHVLLNCGHHCAHARQSLVTSPMWSDQNVKFCHFLGACGALTMPYYVKQ